MVIYFSPGMWHCICIGDKVCWILFFVEKAMSCYLLVWSCVVIWFWHRYVSILQELLYSYHMNMGFFLLSLSYVHVSFPHIKAMFPLIPNVFHWTISVIVLSLSFLFFSFIYILSKLFFASDFLLEFFLKVGIRILCIF